MSCKRLSVGLIVSFIGVFTVRSVCGGGSVVPVGTYLYANPENPAAFRGSLSVSFTTPGPERLVLAYGRKYRKDRKTRESTDEEQRQIYKPWLASLANNGREARFTNLPPDYYDLIVIDPQRMSLHEGIDLVPRDDPALASAAFMEEIQASLGLRSDRIGGWEAFFDTKAFARFETDGSRAGILLQQMRLGTALAESGAVLKGCIHSIDVVWGERAKVEGAGWQVLARQQLYRDEIPARTFFTHHATPDLQAIRVGLKAKHLSDVELPGTAD